MPDIKPVQTERRPIGRPSDVNGKRVQVYLDVESLKTAAQIGNGNVSEGIRRALKTASEKAP